MRAIEHGKHVFAEKPLTIELARSRRSCSQAARAAGVQHGVIQNMRFNAGAAQSPRPDRARARRARLQRQRAVRLHGPADGAESADLVLQEGRSGRRHRRGHDGPLLRPAADAGRTDRSRLRRARASPGHERREPDGTPFAVEVEDLASVSIRFANGAVGNCFASWVRRKHEEVPTFQIDGEDGSLYFSLQPTSGARRRPRRRCFGTTRAPCRPTRIDDWQSVEVERARPVRAAAASCSWRASRAASRRPGLPTWEDAVTNQRLIQAAYRSVTERREVRPRRFRSTAAAGASR